MVELIASTVFSSPRNVYFATRSANGTIAPHSVRFTDNSVGLPVAGPLLYLYDAVALRNVHAAKASAPTGMACSFPVWLLAASSKMFPQFTASSPNRLYEVVERCRLNGRRSK